MTSPRTIRLSQALALRVTAPIYPVVVCQAWHELHRHDPAHRWLRDAIRREAGAAPQPRPRPENAAAFPPHTAACD